MIKTITLSNVSFYEKDREGKLLTYKGRDGKTHRYKRIIIESPDLEKKASGFIGSSQDSMNEWKGGMQVTVDVYEKDGYLNFREPKESDYLKQRVEDLERRVKKLEAQSFKDGVDELEEKVEDILDEDEIRAEDIPF